MKPTKASMRSALKFSEPINIDLSAGRKHIAMINGTIMYFFFIAITATLKEKRSVKNAGVIPLIFVSVLF
ncbi:hypothetical protein KAR91_71135 [Candidatus Pacearchaeota archaeon]|nr:hypothetical protein [Candidatus Pacearchaeota archaeon]